ncbi:hypothetical protein ACTOJ1_000696 [Shigella flexneri]
MKDMNVEETQFFTVIILTSFINMLLSVVVNDSQSAVFSFVVLFGGFLFHKTYSNLEK